MQLAFYISAAAAAAAAAVTRKATAARATATHGSLIGSCEKFAPRGKWRKKRQNNNSAAQRRFSHSVTRRGGCRAVTTTLARARRRCHRPAGVSPRDVTKQTRLITPLSPSPSKNCNLSSSRNALQLCQTSCIQDITSTLLSSSLKHFQSVSASV